MRATAIFAAAILLRAAAFVAADAATGRDVVLVGNSLAVPAAGRSLLHGGEDHDEAVAADEDASEVRHAAAMYLILSVVLLSQCVDLPRRHPRLASSSVSKRL
jgi:hypothetical protein